MFNNKICVPVCCNILYNHKNTLMDFDESKIHLAFYSHNVSYINMAEIRNHVGKGDYNLGLKIDPFLENQFLFSYL